MGTQGQRQARRARTVAGAGLIAAAGLWLAPVAAAATTTNVVTNPGFSQPGVDGSLPTGWTASDFDHETAPYKSSNIEEFDLNGQYPPPAPIPGGNTFADEAYYSAGSSTGSEGYGGSQAVTGVTQASDAQVGYSTVETYDPSTTLVTWAGSVYEIDLTSGGQSYELRYFNPWTPGASGSYAGAPTNTSFGGVDIGYVIGPQLTDKVWYTATPSDLDTAVATTFGLSTFTVTGVRYGDLEDTTDSGYPYPNMTGYFTGLQLDTASPIPPPTLPESPLTAALPIAAAAAIGGTWALRRRARRA